MQPNNPLETLPTLPDAFYQSQCVPLLHNKEVLICGGYERRRCYSYHLEKKEYRALDPYPWIHLEGHVVIGYFSNHRDRVNTFTLLSFGGNGVRIAYHSLLMKYKSVWNYQDEKDMQKKLKIKRPFSSSSPLSLSTSSFPATVFSQNTFNQWMFLPNHIKLGEKQGQDWYGARAVIGGWSQNLLLVSNISSCIHVYNLKSFEPLEDVKNNVLPVTKSNQVIFHCFVAVPSDSGSEFIFMSEGVTFLIFYHESKKEFSYQTLSLSYALTSYYGYACVYSGRRLYILGGTCRRPFRFLDEVWTFDIKEKYWKKSEFKLPFEVSDSMAAMTDSSILFMGGKNSKGYYQNVHYMLSILTLDEIEIIVDCWLRKYKIKRGWIKEFYDMLADYITIIE